MSLPEKKTKETTEIAGLSQLEKAADYIVKSRLFGVQTKDQAVALMLLAQAEGIHPMKAVQEYHIIQGRPALKADAMLARFLQAGGKVRWHKLTETECFATFSHPQGGEATIKWTWEMAKKAGLTEKKNRDGTPNNWQKYPRAMLRARVISEGIRTVFPVICVGIYTPEEVVDFDEDISQQQEQDETITIDTKAATNSSKNIKQHDDVQEEDQEQEEEKKQLLSKIKDIALALGWTRETGTEFLKKMFNRKSTKELSVGELRQLIVFMEKEHENKKKEAWEDIDKMVGKRMFTIDDVEAYAKRRHAKRSEEMTYTELKDMIKILSKKYIFDGLA